MGIVYKHLHVNCIFKSVLCEHLHLHVNRDTTVWRERGERRWLQKILLVKEQAKVPGRYSVVVSDFLFCLTVDSHMV